MLHRDPLGRQLAGDEGEERQQQRHDEYRDWSCGRAQIREQVDEGLGEGQRGER
jgi:hypothetical protein